ncbi:hypothetical protein GTS_07430 [Gandjariella thermophila]|uniref:Uncharacterized protein n=1 Tax=Gandjariella thermophila TaxID=1931992 RepID=A0A4D4J1R9_9PSEU|nr:hypothetical protein GTS_07430 [Gandjariella thermophila]
MSRIPVAVDAGYYVFAPNLGGLPGSPFQAMGPIAETARQLADYVARVLAATGASKVDIVGHGRSRPPPATARPSAFSRCGRTGRRRWRGSPR